LSSRSGPRGEVDEGWKPGEKEFDIEAELKVGFGGLEERYVSRVVGRPFDSVTVSRSIAVTPKRTASLSRRLGNSG